MQFVNIRTTGMAALLIGVLGAGCAVVGPGERGVRQTLGQLGDEVHGPGTVGHWPLVASVVKVPVQTTKLEVNLVLPSKEGLSVAAELSILYRVKPESVRTVIQDIGPDYESSLILVAFRSAAADIASQHEAKDMYSSARSAIEDEIAEHLNHNIGDRGFEVQAVLLKSIRLPQRVADAVEAKLAAEQQAAQMAFVLQAERREADRRRVEAEGIRDAQRIVDQGLSPLLIQWQAIEAFRALARSPNAKVIITDGRSPLLLPTDSPSPDTRTVRGSAPAPQDRTTDQRAMFSRDLEPLPGAR